MHPPSSAGHTDDWWMVSTAPIRASPKLAETDLSALDEPAYIGETDNAHRQVTELRARLDDALAQFTAGHLTGASLANTEATLLPQIAEAEIRLRRVVVPLTDVRSLRKEMRCRFPTSSS